MLTGKKAIIFDMDGSLVDSMWIWTEVDIEFGKKYNLTYPEGFQKELEGKSYTETAQYFLDTFPSLTLSIDEIKQEWLDQTLELYTTKVPLKEGVLDFIKQMHEKGMLFGIATSNARALAIATLKALHVEQYFSFVCTACEVNAGKPAPDVYLKVAEQLHVQPEECLVFEDVPQGIIAGKRAGMSVCAVDDEFSRADQIEKKELADYFIYDYTQIFDQTYEICKEKINK